MPLRAKEIVKGMPARSASLRTLEAACRQEAEDKSAKMTFRSVSVVTPSKRHLRQLRYTRDRLSKRLRAAFKRVLQC